MSTQSEQSRLRSEALAICECWCAGWVPLQGTGGAAGAPAQVLAGTVVTVDLHCITTSQSEHVDVETPVDIRRYQVRLHVRTEVSSSR